MTKITKRKYLGKLYEKAEYAKRHQTRLDPAETSLMLKIAEVQHVGPNEVLSRHMIVRFKKWVWKSGDPKLKELFLECAQKYLYQFLYFDGDEKSFLPGIALRKRKGDSSSTWGKYEWLVKN